MRRLILGLGVFASCDFPRLPRLAGDGGLAELDAALAPAPDAASIDAASVDSSGGRATDCLQQWLDGTLQFATPRLMTELASTAERDPWISEDGLRLYFVRSPGTKGGSDVYLATRASASGNFDTPIDLVNLNGPSDESRPALNGDELTIVFARDPTSGGESTSILLARRSAQSSPFPSPIPDDMVMQAINADATAHLDPFLSRDGLRLYFAPSESGRQQIRMATRPTTDAAFSAPMVVPGVGRSSVDADPALSADERILVFSSASISGTELWYATRSSSADPFGAPILVPGIHSTAADGDPMLSADGCELYFSSTRGGARHIYHANVVR